MLSTEGRLSHVPLKSNAWELAVSVCYEDSLRDFRRISERAPTSNFEEHALPILTKKTACGFFRGASQKRTRDTIRTCYTNVI
jgi:hypothetical protein